MKQLRLYTFLTLALLSAQACSSEKKNEQAATVAASDEKVNPNRKLSVEIEGMVCEKGCGASIRKALKATGGVASCSIDFEEDRAKNKATIEFDKDKVTADKLIDIITSINEKQFTVSNASSSQLEVKINVKESSADSGASDETAELHVSHAPIEVPNFLRLFSTLLTRN